MNLALDADGAQWLRGCTLLCLDTFRRMFGWIEDSDPSVRARLYPETFGDPAEEAAWRQLMRPDLEHLVRSRQAIVLGDLGRLRSQGDGLYAIPLPKEHEAAWLSSLNAARLALFALHGLAAGDLDADPEDLVDDDKHLALVRIHLMAYAQEQIITGPG